MKLKLFISFGSNTPQLAALFIFVIKNWRFARNHLIPHGLAAWLFIFLFILCPFAKAEMSHNFGARFIYLGMDGDFSGIGGVGEAGVIFVDGKNFKGISAGLGIVGGEQEFEYDTKVSHSAFLIPIKGWFGFDMFALSAGSIVSIWSVEAKNNEFEAKGLGTKLLLTAGVAFNIKKSFAIGADFLAGDGMLGFSIGFNVIPAFRQTTDPYAGYDDYDSYKEENCFQRRGFDSTDVRVSFASDEEICLVSKKGGKRCLFLSDFGISTYEAKFYEHSKRSIIFSRAKKQIDYDKFFEHLDYCD